MKPGTREYQLAIKHLKEGLTWKQSVNRIIKAAKERWK